jgi:hypothetical protein
MYSHGFDVCRVTKPETLKEEIEKLLAEPEA